MIIQDDGIQLDCVWTRPEGKQKGPAAVMLHGFTGYKDEPHLLAVEQAFLSCGVSVLRADLFGHGKSGGEFRNHTLYKWAENAMTLIDHARAQDIVTEVYLCGHSQGGLTAIMAAGMKADQIRGLITLSAAAMIPEGARRGELLGEHFDPGHVPDTVPAWGNRELSGNYVRVAQSIRVEDFIDRYQGPVLMVHGGDDGAVLPRVSEEAAKRYQNADLCIIPGDGHCYEHHLDQCAAAVRKWMEGQLSEK